MGFQGRFRDRNAEMFLVKNVEVCLDSSARTFPDKCVTTSQGKFATMCQGKFPERNAEMCRDNNAGVCLARCATTFPGSSAEMFPDKNVVMCRGNSANRCQSRSATQANQTMDEIFTKQHVPDFHTTETYDLSPKPMYLCI